MIKPHSSSLRIKTHSFHIQWECHESGLFLSDVDTRGPLSAHPHVPIYPYGGRLGKTPRSSPAVAVNMVGHCVRT